MTGQTHTTVYNKQSDSFERFLMTDDLLSSMLFRSIDLVNSLGLFITNNPANWYACRLWIVI